MSGCGEVGFQHPRDFFHWPQTAAIRPRIAAIEEHLRVAPIVILLESAEQFLQCPASRRLQRGILCRVFERVSHIHRHHFDLLFRERIP
jgi:hypothetical protein